MEDLTSAEPKKKCAVCGVDKASSHFGAVVCLACKTFFIRCSNDDTTQVQCNRNGGCEVTALNRAGCKACRFKKCLNVGMTRLERPALRLPKDGEQLCQVCGDFANGTHFGVSSCEGCRKFFRRGLKEAHMYVCKYNQDCTINPQTRNNCRYCRYQKCIGIGMALSAIKMGRPTKAEIEARDKIPLPAEKQFKEDLEKFEPRIYGPPPPSFEKKSVFFRPNTAKKDCLQPNDAINSFENNACSSQQGHLPNSFQTNSYDSCQQYSTNLHQQHNPNNFQTNAYTSHQQCCTNHFHTNGFQIQNRHSPVEKSRPDFETKAEIISSTATQGCIKSPKASKFGGKDEHFVDLSVDPENQCEPPSMEMEYETCQPDCFAWPDTSQIQNRPLIGNQCITRGPQYQNTQDGAMNLPQPDMLCTPISILKQLINEHLLNSLPISNRKDGEEMTPDHPSSITCIHIRNDPLLSGEMDGLFNDEYWENPQLPTGKIVFTESLKTLIDTIVSNYQEMIASIDEPVRPSVGTILKAMFDPLAVPKALVKERIRKGLTSWIRYLKNIPDMYEMEAKDQYTLIKYGGIESGILIASIHWYNPQEKNFRNFYDIPMHPENPQFHLRRMMVEFAAEVNKYQIDDVEGAFLTTCMGVASDWPGLQNVESIEKTRQPLLEAFRAYTTAKYGMNNNRIETLFKLLPCVRRLGVWQCRLSYSTWLIN